MDIFKFTLWARGMIRTLIKKQFKVDLCGVMVGQLLKILGFIPQKPLYIAYEQDTVMVQSWLGEEFLRIKK